MVLIPPPSQKDSGKEAGPVVRLLGAVAFVVVMWGLFLFDLLQRPFR